MDKEMYLTELKQRLASLPLSEEDISDALRFYGEFFSEAGPDREQFVIDTLGSPAYVAAQIALNLSSSASPMSAHDAKAGCGSPRKRRKTGIRRRASLLWTVILGTLASPIALPLAVAAVLVFLSLLIASAALVLSLWAAGVACVASGIVAAVYAVSVVTTDSATCIFFSGAGFFAGGLGVLLFMLGGWAGKSCTAIVKCIPRLVSKNTPVHSATLGENIYQPVHSDLSRQ